jgi:uncharacterized RDD family membrane protein YckC
VQTPNPYAPPAAAPGAPLVPAAATADVSRADYAGFGARAAARLLDMVVVGIPVAICLFVVLLSEHDPTGHTGIDRILSAAQLGGFAADVSYHSVAAWIGGATFGKMALGLRVRSAAKLGPCTLIRALVRSVAYYVDGLFFGFVAYGAMSQSPTKQRLGDRWAGTVVVRAGSLADGGPPGTLVVMGAVLGVVAALTAMFIALASR